MNAAQANKIETFLRSVVRRCKEVHLFMMLDQGRLSRVNWYSLGDVELFELAKQIDSDVREDAKGVGGMCRYNLQGLDAAGEVVQRMPLRQQGELVVGEVAQEDPATAQGSLQQGMRHTEFMMKTAAELIQEASRQVMAVSQTVLKENQRLAEAQEGHELRRLESFQMHEDLLSDAHARDLAAANAKQLAEYRTRILTKVIEPILPRILSKGLDTLLPEDGLRGQLRNFISSLDNEQLEKIIELGVLKPGQQQQFFTIVEAFAKEEKEKELRRAAAAAAASQPAAAAASPES